MRGMPGAIRGKSRARIRTIQGGLSIMKETIQRIEPVAQDWLERAAARQLQLTKPPGSLGELEVIANRLAAIQQTLRPAASRRRIYVVAADPGGIREGVSAYAREVTAQMVYNFLRGGAAINVLARQGGIEVGVVDAGVDADFGDAPGLIQAKVVRGTANFTRGPAMTRDEAVKSVEIGINLARVAAADGIELLGIGEMGIGNTTAASAITATLTGPAPEPVPGHSPAVADA